MKFKKSAFTLIELLVVIVIIGILATISVSTFSGYFKKAKAAKIASELRSIEKGFKLAATINDQELYPTEISLGVNEPTIKKVAELIKIKDIPFQTN